MTTIVADPTLFDPDQHTRRDLTLEERAARWIETNPAAVQRFADIALDLHARGERMGAKAIAEVIRWQHIHDVDRVDGDDWRVNNSYVSHLARYVMVRWPELDGYFETRGQS